jgi:ATP-dependent RNA helicase SUPV3L1/SUV3
LRSAAHALRPFGVRIGRRSIFLPRLIKPAPSALAALLWAVHARLAHIPPPPQPGLTSFALDADGGAETSDAFLAAAFYRRLATRAVRLDILERIESVLVEASQLSKNVADTMTVLVSLLGCAKEDVAAIAAALGWRQVMRAQKGAELAEPIPVWQRARGLQGRARKGGRPAKQAVPDSPFARLAELI